MRISHLLVVSLTLLVVGCETTSTTQQDDDAPTTTQVKLQLNWYPEAEHGGYYAADVHGLFAREELAVTIEPGGPGRAVLQRVATGKIDFAVTNADRVAFARDAGLDIVAVMAPIQDTPRCIMVHRESGITSLEQLSDVKLAIGAGPAFYDYMNTKLPLKNIQTVTYRGGVGSFVADKKFAQQAYVFSEPFLAKQQGADPVTLMVSELGYNPYASVLVCTKKTLDERPALVQKMVRACVEGWEQYLTDATTTNKHISELNKEIDVDALVFGAQQITPLCRPANSSDVRMGEMTAARWQSLIDQLGEIEKVTAANIDVNEMFTTQFLPTTD